MSTLTLDREEELKHPGARGYPKDLLVVVGRQLPFSVRLDVGHLKYAKLFAELTYVSCRS
ncbi:MAG: hypothetical protein AB7V04_00280 [Desulfomonilaceae bacterium]